MTSDLLRALLLNAGVDPLTESRASLAGGFFESDGVYEGDDFRRIRALPRRDPFAAPDVDQLVELMTRAFSRPGSKVRLFPLQALALRELHDTGKLCTFASVGSGKSLVSALAPVVFGAQRPLFVTYARLIKKTVREFREMADHGWLIAQNYQFLNAERVVERKKVEGALDFLEKYNPDLIVIDEVQAFRPRSGRSKRLKRFKKTHPDCVIVGLTGTPGDDKIEKPAFLQELTLGEGSPYPLEYAELLQWGQALDAISERRRPPGVLTEFSQGADSLDEVRIGVGRQASQVEGNVWYRKSSAVNCSLYLDAVKFDGFGSELEGLFENARENDEAPDGRVYEEACFRAVILKNMACGFSKLLDPAPPLAWKEARKLWFGYVREILSQSKLGFDIPMQVALAASRGELQDGGLYAAWKEIEPTFKPRHVTVWHDLGLVNFCADWLCKVKGLVWTPYPVFGDKLAEVTGLPYFHNLGKCEHTGLDIDTYREPTGAVLATAPNLAGRNLQRWNKNLIVAPGSKADDLEQLLGRTHRYGQEADEVEAIFVLACRENWNSLQTARERARFDASLGRNESSKLLTCDWLVPELSEVHEWTGARWEK